MENLFLTILKYSPTTPLPPLKMAGWFHLPRFTGKSIQAQFMRYTDHPLKKGILSHKMVMLKKKLWVSEI